MISDTVRQARFQIQERFQTSKPFKSVCVDDFLIPEIAETALADFPAFDRSKAVNEFGEIGGKAVNTKLGEISPFYAIFYKWLFSEDFLTTMSEMTGIPDLIGDPTMYGGGTHENLHGQELDPHVDFNYVSGGEAHRRVNLLIYLNKGWRSEWGGDIEMHSNPREPDTNQIISYTTIFNRAVLFETNEYSWHGFPRIDLPIDQRGLRSRKSLSIYLYTKTRPTHEIAGTHGTFYVQRPIPKHLKAGAILTSSDADELRRGYRNRDRSIEAYQKQEEKLGSELDNLHKYLNEIIESIKIPIAGSALQVRRTGGVVWHDGWVGGEFSFEIRALADITSIELSGTVPNWRKSPGMEVRLGINNNNWCASLIEGEQFRVLLPVVIMAGDVFELMVHSNTTRNPKKTGDGVDDRDLAFILNMARFS